MARSRASVVWALAAGFVLAALLIFATHPLVLTRPEAGMSAPIPRSASIESAPAIRVLPTHIDVYGSVPRPAAPVPPLTGVGLGPIFHWVAAAAEPHYGPLHRRPPPSLS